MDGSDSKQRDFSDKKEWDLKALVSSIVEDDVQLSEIRGEVPQVLRTSGIKPRGGIMPTDCRESGVATKLNADLSEGERQEECRKPVSDDTVDQLYRIAKLSSNLQDFKGSTELQLCSGIGSVSDIKDAKDDNYKSLYSDLVSDELEDILELCSSTLIGKSQEFGNIPTAVSFSDSLSDIQDDDTARYDHEIEILCYAVETGDMGIIQRQLSNGVDVTAKNSSCKSAIECATEMDKKEIIQTLTYRKIIVPEFGNSLFWACSLAYLVPVRYDDKTFEEKFEKLFGCPNSTEELKKVQEKIQGCGRTSSYLVLLSDRLLKKFVSENFRDKVLAEISLLQEEFEKSVTLSDLLNSKNENYVTGGAFQEQFRQEFNNAVDQYHIDISKFKPEMWNETSAKAINSELQKISDQDKVNKFIFRVYLERMRDTNSWGGKYEMQAISHMLCCCVHVFSDGTDHRSGDKEYSDQMQLFNNGESRYDFGLIRTPVFIEAIKNNEEQKAKSYISFGIDDANYKTNDGWTSLHFVAQHGYEEIVHPLLAQGADPCIENNFNQTPLDVACKFGKDNVINQIQKWNEEGESIEISSGRSSPVDREQDENKEIYVQLSDAVEDHPTYKRFGESGLSGQLYEMVLSMFFLLQGLAKKQSGQIENFYLATNLEEAGEFDDVLFKYKYKDKDGIEKAKIIFLQAKHKEHPDSTKERVNFEKFFRQSGKKGDFTLKDYFRSYLEVKYYFSKSDAENPITEGNFDELDCDFIIYTNALSNLNKKPKNIEEIIANYTQRKDWKQVKDVDGYYVKKIDLDKQDILYLPENEEGNHYYEIVLGGKHEDTIIELLKSASVNKKGKEKDDSQRSRSTKKSGNCEKERKPQEKKFRCSDGVGESGGSEGMSPANLPVSEMEIDKFLKRLKIFVQQPGEEKFSAIIKQRIRDTYRVEESDAKRIFSDVRGKIEEWWKEDEKSKYITEENKFFEESATISVSFDLKKQCDFFVGRNDELIELHTNLNAGRITVISQNSSLGNSGGIGKTELAIKYAHEYSHEYDNNIIWINAADYESLVGSFGRLAMDKLKVKTQSEQENDIKSIRDEIYKYFEKKKKCLFIFDNAAKCATAKNMESVIDKFLPPLPRSQNIHVLITSRGKEWENFYILSLDVLTADEAQEFIYGAIGTECELPARAVTQLSDVLNYFPLALVRAVEYIRDENKRWQTLAEVFSFENYLEIYTEEEKKINKVIDLKSCEKYRVPIFITWKIALERIKVMESDNHGVDILDIIGYFAPTNISTRIFFESLIYNPEGRSCFQLLKLYSGVAAQQREIDIYRTVRRVLLSCMKTEKDSDVLRIAELVLYATMEGENRHCNAPFKHRYGSLQELHKDCTKTDIFKRPRQYSV